MTINPSIFREYDIRGITEADHSPELIEEYEKWYGPFPGVTLSRETAHNLGKAYGTAIRNNGGRKIIIGYEVRPFSVEIKDSFVEGVLSTGCSVLDAGPSLTPFIYFAVAFYNLDGGVSVTGSHNVYFFNGFKLMRKNVFPIYGKELQTWQQLINENKFIQESPGTRDNIDLFAEYKKYFLSHFHLQKKLKIVIDSGNSTPGRFAPDLFHSLGCEVEELFSEPDATFPNHLPDPEDPYMMQFLSQKVREIGADIGIAFDADGDRFGSVDEKGNYVGSDKLIALLAKDYLSRHPGSEILYDVKCSRTLENLIRGFKGIPLMHKTGHAPIKHTLRENENIIFGGELSGHMYFVENYFKIDDGLYAAAKILELLAATELKYSSLFDFIPVTIQTPEIKLPCEDSTKHLIVQAINDYFAESYTTITIDGTRINFSSTSWALVKASNTAPYLSVRIEADTSVEILRIKNILADQLETHSSIMDKLDRSSVTSYTGKLGWL